MITAIFLLVVLGTLGSMMASFFVTQQQSSALDVMGSRAYQAARTGIEWGQFHIVNSAAGAGCGAIPVPLFANTLARNLSPFTVTLTCAVSLPITEGAATIYVYNLTSTAVAGGAPGSRGYVERVITATIGR